MCIDASRSVPRVVLVIAASSRGGGALTMVRSDRGAALARRLTAPAGGATLRWRSEAGELAQAPRKRAQAAREARHPADEARCPALRLRLARAGFRARVRGERRSSRARWCSPSPRSSRFSGSTRRRTEPVPNALLVSRGRSAASGSTCRTSGCRRASPRASRRSSARFRTASTSSSPASRRASGWTRPLQRVAHEVRLACADPRGGARRHVPRGEGRHAARPGVPPARRPHRGGGPEVALGDARPDRDVRHERRARRCGSRRRACASAGCSAPRRGGDTSR